MATIEVKNKNILITGGANGIGKALTQALCPYNKVYVVDRDRDKLAKLQNECSGIVPICCDLSDWEGTRRELENTLPEVVHGLVNNAGIGAPANILNCTEEALDQVLAVNTRAIVNVSQVVAKRVIQYNEKQANDGKETVMCSIVNMSSLASRFPTRVSMPYCVSKAAVDMLTKGMALELGPHNIRVNSVNPNIVMGTDLSSAWVGTVGAQLKDKLVSRTPLGRVVEISDVVNTIIFLLASEQVAMIHGDSLFVDGGFSVM